MRSKILHISTIAILIAILFAELNDKLIYYIHPRYVGFTVLLTFLGLILLVFDLLLNKKRRQSYRSAWLVFIVALLGIMLSPKTLTSSIATDRTGNSGYLGQLSQDVLPQTTYDSFSRDLTRFTILDWVNLIGSSTTDSQIINKQAEVEGFVLKKDDQYFVARFKLTCCAVDATPLTIALAKTPEQELRGGHWYRIEGDFIKTDSLNHPLQLQIKSYEEIAEPEDPYVY